MKLWLDDIRCAPPGWVRCMTAQEVIAWLRLSGRGDISSPITDVSLDHDLGQIEETGYEVIKFIQESLVNDSWKGNVPRLTCHSDNPVGRKDIELGIRSIHRLASQKGIVIHDKN